MLFLSSSFEQDKEGRVAADFGFNEDEEDVADEVDDRSQYVSVTNEL